jgi:hypothetical protein
MAPLEVDVAGSTITINGLSLDLSPLEDGDQISAEATGCASVEDVISRTGDTITVRLLFPIRPDAPDTAKYPAPIIVAQDGPVELPQTGAAA